MINVPMTAGGPDMDVVEKLVAADGGIKGMWCVPKYSNPSGTVYSRETVRRLAAMKTAAPDFRLMWDDAYRFHHLSDEKVVVPNILDACEKAGHPDRAFVFASTSKITFAGAGLAALAASPANFHWWQKHVSVRSIGPDKVNQLRHVRFLKDKAHVEALMEAHRKLLQPKFDAVLEHFAEYLGNTRRGELDASEGWLFHRSGYAARPCQAHRGAGARSGHYADARRRRFPVRQRPERQPYPYCAELSVADRDYAGGEGDCYLPATGDCLLNCFLLRRANCGIIAQLKL